MPFKTQDTGIWLEASELKQPLAIFQLLEQTKIVGNLHAHTIKEHENKSIHRKVMPEVLDWIRQNTGYEKVIGTVAEGNIKVRAILAKHAFRVCGIISNGIIENNQLQNLLIFELNLR